MILTGDENEFNEEFNEWFKHLPEEERSRILQQADEQWEQIKKHPLFKKAQDILGIAAAIVESLPEEQHRLHIPMVQAAMLLGSKFAGAYGSGMWLLQIEGASLMRYYAEHLIAGTYGLNVEKEVVDNRYVELLRTELKTYKQLFNEWIQTVHAMPRDPQLDADEWGVFVRA